MIESTIQLGEPVEHRGLVVAPLFPRTTPRAEYLKLDEAIRLAFASRRWTRPARYPSWSP